MKTYRISLEGKSYEVQVEDISNGASETRNTTTSPKVQAAAPVSAQPITAAVTGINSNTSSAQSTSNTSAKVQSPSSASANDVVAPVTGTILRFEVKVGDVVQAGQSLIILEAMKMETEVQAPKAGKVAKILVSSGANVSTGQALLVLEDE